MSQLKSYEYVIAIVEQGGVSQAAEALHIAQPALSRYLKKLETELETDLFDRSVIPIRLTEAGRLYVEAGREILAAQHQLSKQLEELRSGRNALVRIGISPTRSPYLMPALIQAYRSVHPSGRVVIEEHNSAELHRLLAQGDLDVMISWLDADTAEFACVPLFDEDIWLAVPKSWQYRAEDVLTVMRERQMISVGKGLALWHLTQKLIQSIGADFPAIECQSIETALSFVKCGIGATLVPSYIVQFSSAEQNRELQFMPLPTEQFPDSAAYRRQICLFYRREQRLTKAEQAFIACAREVKRAP